MMKKEWKCMNNKRNTNGDLISGVVGYLRLQCAVDFGMDYINWLCIG